MSNNKSNKFSTAKFSSEIPQSNNLKNKKPWLLVDLTVLLIIFVGSTTYFAYQNYRLKRNIETRCQEISTSNKESSNEELSIQKNRKSLPEYGLPIIREDQEPLEETESLSIEEAEKFQNYNGEFLSASLPASWRIIEYRDGKGTDNLSDGEYRGLTGMEIRDSSNRILFQLSAVYGIGGREHCEKIYIFNTADDYTYNAIEYALFDLQRNSLPDYKPEIVYLGNNFVEMSVFGTKLRRIGYKYYWSESFMGEFVPLCDNGMDNKFVHFPILKFDIVDKPSDSRFLNGHYSNLYSVRIFQEIPVEEYPMLDAVLSSLKTL